MIMLPIVNPPDAPFEPKPYLQSVIAAQDPNDPETWTDEMWEDCQCPWLFHGWEGCPTPLPEVPDWVYNAMVCDDCRDRHTL